MVDYTQALRESQPEATYFADMPPDSAWHDGVNIPLAEDTTRPKPGWGFIDFGQQMLHAGVDILSRFPEAVGTVTSWVDRDIDEDDLMSTGARWLDDFGDAAREWIREVAPVDYEVTDFDTALEAWNEGKQVKPMLRFMRDNAPTGLVYLAAAWAFRGVPLGIAETQRALDVRMKYKGLTTADATLGDFMAAVGVAVTNVFLERLPWMRAIRPGKKFSFPKFMLMENATEFGQGANEDIVTKIGTPEQWSYTSAFKEGMAEMIGGFGVVAATSPLASMRSAEVNRRLAAQEEADAERDRLRRTPPITGETPLPPMTVPEGPRTLGGFQPPITPSGYESTVTIGAPQFGAATAEGTIVQPLGEEGAYTINEPTVTYIPPITKPIPGTPDLNLEIDAAVDAALGARRTVGGTRRSPAQIALLAKYGQPDTKEGWTNVRNERKKEKDAADAAVRTAAKDTATVASTVDKLTLVSAANEASADFDTFMDDSGGDITVANDRMVNRARQIRETHGEKIAARYRKTYLARQNEFDKEQKRRGIVVAPDVKEGTPAPPADKSVPPVPPTDEKRTIGGPAAAAGPARMGPGIVSHTYNNEAGMEIVLTPLEDGRIQATADGNPLGATGIFGSVSAARKAAKTETQDKVKARATRITTREEKKRLAEERKIQAAKDKVESDKAKAIAAEQEKKRIAEREKAKRDRMVAESERIDALEKREDQKEADKAKREADAEERARREAEIEAQAVKEKPTLAAILKATKYTTKYNKLEDAGKREVNALLSEAAPDADFNTIVKEEIDSALKFEEEEREGGEVVADEEGPTLMDMLRAQVEVEDVEGARETVSAIKEEGTKAEIAAANKILAGMTKAADRTVVTPPVRMAGKRAERTKTQAATFAAMKKIPNVTGVSEVLAMDPETFIWKVDNTKAQGGYEMSQMRKIAEQIPEVDGKLARPQLSTALKVWYGQQNNPDTLLSPDTTKKLAMSGYTVTRKKGSSKRESGIDSEFLERMAEKHGWTLQNVLRYRDQEVGRVRGMLVKVMNSFFGDTAAKNMLDLGFIHFGTRNELETLFEKEGDPYEISSNTAGITDDHTGHIYFVLDQISMVTDKDIPGRHTELQIIKGLVLHEIGVHFGKNALEPSDWINIQKALVNLWVEGDPLVVKAFNEARSNIQDQYGEEFPDMFSEGAFWHGTPWFVRAILGDPAAATEPLTERQKTIADTLWEETLAYFATQNPDTIKVGKSKALWATIEQAVRKFFKNLLLTFNPAYRGVEANITSEDIKMLVSHLSMHVPDLAFAMHGEGRKQMAMRIKTRNAFIKDSVEKNPVYHASLEQFSFPVFGVADLGFHFGTERAAMDRGDSLKANAVLERRDDLMAMTEEGRLEPVVFTEKYYINIKNPLNLNRDLGTWKTPYAWFEHTFNYENSIVDNVSPFVSKQWQEFITKWHHKYPQKDIGVMTNDAKFKVYNEFRQAFVSFWKARGFDGIRYVNDKEDPGSISYIAFDEEQISLASSYTFNPLSKQKRLATNIGGTEADNVKGNVRAALDAAATVANTYKAVGIGRSTWQSIHKFFDPMAIVGAREILMKGRYAARGEATVGENLAKNIFDIFQEATKPEQDIIYKYLTTRGASPDMLPDRNVKFKIRETIFLGRRKGKGTGRQIRAANLKDQAIEVKDMIEALGKELVSKGLVPSFEERFESLRGEYLPKMYLRYVLGDKYRRLGGGMKPSPLDYMKVRELHSEWMAKVLYGEIKDPGFLASKYIGTVTHDLAMVNYLNFIVSDPANQGWVLPRGLVTWRGQSRSIYWLEAESTDLINRADIQEKTEPDLARQMREMAAEMRALSRKAEPDVAGYDMKSYRQLPDHPRFAGARGLYIKKEIYDDVEGWAGPTGEQPVIAEIFSRQGWGGLLQRTFKYRSVIANPPTLVRNIGSNTMLLHTSGVSMFQIPRVLHKAMSEILNDGKYYRIAQEHGIETTSFAHEELRAIDREFAKLESGADLMAKFKLFLSDANVGGRFYQKSEVVFKLAKLIDGMENKKLNAADAALEAQEAILDYSLVSPSVRFLRSVPFGAPFITFQIKVLPQLLKNLRKHPLSFAPYVALPYIMAGIFAGANDVDDDDVKKLKQHLGEWARDRSGIHFLPSKDENGKWVALDIGYMLPWTAWYETANDMYKMEFSDAWQGTGFFSGPVDILKGWESNVDPFTRQPIWNDLDPPQQQYQDILIFIASYMVPPFMNPRGRAGGVTTGGGPAVKLLMAAGLKDGNIGVDGLPKYTIASSIMAMFGFNTYTLDPSTQLARNLKWMTSDLNKTKARLLQLIKDPGISEDKRQQLIDEYIAHMQNKMTEIQEYVASVEGMSEKLR